MTNEKQVREFVDKFIAEVEWMKTPEGVESLADKATMDDGTISEEAMVRWLMMYGFDAAKDIGLEGNELHDVIASAILGWAMQSFVKEDRVALRPMYEKYVNE